MALKTKPDQITAEDRQLVRDFIRDSKAAGYDPTLTTIILNKTKTDPGAAKSIANLQKGKSKSKGVGKDDAARAARSLKARREAERAGRESKAIKDEGGYLTQEEWLKAIAGTAAFASLPILAAALGGGAVAGGVAAGGRALTAGAKRLLLSSPKVAKKLGEGAKQLGEGAKQLTRAPQKLLSAPRKMLSGPKGSPKPPVSPKDLNPADMRKWVARQEAARKANKTLKEFKRLKAANKAMKSAK